MRAKIWLIAKHDQEMQGGYAPAWCILLKCYPVKHEAFIAISEQLYVQLTTLSSSNDEHHTAQIVPHCGQAQRGDSQCNKTPFSKPLSWQAVLRALNNTVINYFISIVVDAIFYLFIYLFIFIIEWSEWKYQQGCYRPPLRRAFKPH